MPTSHAHPPRLAAVPGTLSPVSDTDDPFELEPEEARTHRPAPYDPGPEPEAEEVVDTRTVAERKGDVRERGADERLPPPAGWPSEALAFPLRKPGPACVALGVMALFLLDLLGTADALRFPGWILKLFLLMFLLRMQFRVIGTSAAGRDGPEGWREALAFDREELSQYWRTMAFFAIALVPGTVLWLFGQVGLGIALLAVGSMYGAVVALGAALRDPALKWPWRALTWVVTRPVHCLLGSLGWWVLLVVEIALHNLLDDGPVVYGFVAVVLRSACLYALLVSARVIGVMGRAWTV